MAAKLLHSLTDENQDLQKQIGCMTGIFQLFDRQHIVTARRITGPTPKRLPAGCSHFNDGTFKSDSNDVYHRSSTMEKNSNKNHREKQRVSMESSRPSFSSSSRSSSFSSVDCNKISQPETSPLDHITFPETPSRDPTTGQSSPSLRFGRGRQSLDLRDLVKDSMYREARGLSVKTTDSSDFKESFRVLSKLRETPLHFNEARELTRSCSYGPKDSFLPRFSYDGREIENSPSNLKLKELPRLSLDSRESSMRSMISESGFDSRKWDQTARTKARSPSVVAKLMGLEVMPETKGNRSVIDSDSLSKSSSRNLWNESNSPRWKSPDLLVKPVSKFPIEPAPWKQPDSNRAFQKTASRSPKALSKASNPFPSVYSEIEKRLNDLEFKQSGKDLRALKQILDAMQAKGLLEARKEGQDSNFTTRMDQEQRILSKKNVVNQRKKPISLRPSESPIVIMKPAKLVEKLGVKSNGKSVRSMQNSTRPGPGPAPALFLGDNMTGSSIKSSGSISPRLQQKKLELEKRSRPPTPPSDSIKSRTQSNKQQMELTSPGVRRRPKLGKDVNTGLVSKIGIEIAGFERSPEVPTKSTSIVRENESAVEVLTVSPDYPSPISILDNAMYTDDSPSPVKQIPNPLKDVGTQNYVKISTEVQWSLEADNPNPGLDMTMSEISREKLQNIHNLVQKLRRLNSTHDEARTDYIASLCDNSNPDHRYISEILLASGLLLRDLGPGLSTFQFHPSGHPINPELFLVLEQTKSKTRNSINEEEENKVVHLKPDNDKFHRKLIFDAVNEILVRKLGLEGLVSEPWLRSRKVARNAQNAQKLLRELCLEIKQLQDEKSECKLEADEGEDGLKRVLWKDVMCRSERWTDFDGEISGMVLDVERSIFKDLVNEIVIDGPTGWQAKPGRRRRQLFAK